MTKYSIFNFIVTYTDVYSLAYLVSINNKYIKSRLTTAGMDSVIPNFKQKIVIKRGLVIIFTHLN